MTVPAGSCTWSSTLSIDKGVSLNGAGIGKTIITKATNTLITYRPANKSANLLIRISGFTFDMGGGQGVVLDVSSGTTTIPQSKLRIDSNRFQNIALGSTQHQFIRHSGNIYGVVDSNEFGLSTYPIRAVYFPGNSVGTVTRVSRSARPITTSSLRTTSLRRFNGASRIATTAIAMSIDTTRSPSPRLCTHCSTCTATKAAATMGAWAGNCTETRSTARLVELSLISEAGEHSSSTTALRRLWGFRSARSSPIRWTRLIMSVPTALSIRCK